MSSSPKVFVIICPAYDRSYLDLDLLTIKHMVENNMIEDESLIEYCQNKKVIVLKSSDEDLFVVDGMVALEFEAIKDRVEVVIENGYDDNYFPLQVSTKILSKVIEYCKKHVEALKTEDKVAEEDLKSFDADFVKVDQGTLFDLILAANYLNIKSLLELTCQTVADNIKGKTPEEIRETFNIQNQTTPEEEEEVRRENAWAFE